MVRMDRELLEVGAAGQGVDAGQPLRRVPGHQDDQGAGEVGRGAGPGQGPDRRALSKSVSAAASRGGRSAQLVGTGDPDVDHASRR